MTYDNTNSGALFRNEKKASEKHPDYRGDINVGGKDFWISGWIKTSKKGTQFMSLSVTEKESVQQTAPVADDFDEDLPF